jgi:outer membrane lipoprotein-sorting protein
MKRKALIPILLIAMFLVLGNDSAQAITAKEIIDRSENAIRGRSQVATVAIIIKKPRFTRIMKLRTWDYRPTKKSFAEIYSPVKDAGNRFLLLDQTMFHYIPKLQKVVRISPSMMLQSWMGSDFTNDDIVKESSILQDYTHTLIGKVKAKNYTCYKVELKPKPDAPVVWGKIIYFARVNDYLPVREEFYNERGVLKKVMTFGGYKKMHDRVIPTAMKMETVNKPDQYTLMKTISVKFNVPISGNIFTVQNLKRR